jgi:glutamate-1-semialdehyde aminotransferase
MDSVPARVLDFWQAFDSLEPIGEHWRQTAETNSLLARLIECQAAKLGVKLDTTTVEDCMPLRFLRKQATKKPEAKATEKDQFQQITNALGFGKIAAKYGRRNKSS